ncbi:MAG: phage portal protein [Clostridia bacterium]|nr:phage portal protein [Clostridia bacterium]MBO7319646.1 phage portal protein [Clostridia bacterium]
MAIGKNKKQKAQSDVISTPQTNKATHPYLSLSGFSPQGCFDRALYRSLREAVPIIDAAIMKTVRLLGTFQASCDDEVAEKDLRTFLSRVNVGGTRNGIDAFISTFFEQLLTYGTAVGEMLTDGYTITHLFNSDLKDISLSEGTSPVDIVISADNGNGNFTPVRYPSLVLLSVLNPEPGKIYGTSVLKGLPFVSDVLLKIYNTIGTNWERLGNVRFSVTYKPQNDTIDKAYAKERAMQVASEWTRTMQSSGTVRDFVAIGDVSIKAIGADCPIPDSNIPVRQLLEQIVAKLGIPPFLLGLSWSTTERMSYQQADILTSEIDFYRREITPVINKICDMYLRLRGYSCDFDIEWNNVTLQDISEIAQSNYYDAQTQKILSEIGGTTEDE